jgi:hypothetical protein
VNRLTALIPAGLQLGITFYVNRFIEPKLKDFLEPLPVVAPPFITLILSGLLVVFLVDLTLARPRLMFRWSDPSSRTARPTVVEIRDAQKEVLDLQVELLGNSWLADLTRWALRSHTTTTVTLDSEDAVALRYRDRSSRSVTVSDDGTAVSLPFAASGTKWVSLEAGLTDRSPPDVHINVRHAIETSGYRSVLARLVVKDHNVTTLRAIRTS